MSFYGVFLRLAISIEHRLVTNRQTDRHTTTAYTAVVRSRAVEMGLKSVKSLKSLGFMVMRF